jgi:hypothetical protein
MTVKEYERKRSLRRHLRHLSQKLSDEIAALNWQLNQGILSIGGETTLGESDPEYQKMAQLRDDLQAAKKRLNAS